MDIACLPILKRTMELGSRKVIAREGETPRSSAVPVREAFDLSLPRDHRCANPRDGT
jgi:hypothetical protein